jgi:hypothetical protein
MKPIRLFDSARAHGPQFDEKTLLRIRARSTDAS